MATDKIVRLSNLKTFLTKLDSRFQKALKFDTTPHGQQQESRHQWWRI